jgi:hypothetical protein
MGLFNFLSRRRERESAIPQAEVDSITGKLDESDAPVGQPIQGVGSPQALGSLGTGQAMDIGSVFGMLGMIKQAYESGNIQISHGENQVVDMRGTADGQALREQIMAAMKQAGIDPGAMPEGTQVDAAQYAGLQQNILDVLAQHGVDVSGGASPSVLPDLDGDGKPG